MDLSQIREHLPLIIGVTVGLVWIVNKAASGYKAAKEFVAHTVDEKLPAAIKASLNNGIGEMMTRLNAEQDKRWLEAMEKAFRDHEVREDAKLERTIDRMRKRKARA